MLRSKVSTRICVQLLELILYSYKQTDEGHYHMDLSAINTTLFVQRWKPDA